MGGRFGMVRENFVVVLWRRGNRSGSEEETEKKSWVRSNGVRGRSNRVWGKRAFENGERKMDLMAWEVPKLTFYQPKVPHLGVEFLTPQHGISTLWRGNSHLLHPLYCFHVAT